MSKGKRDWSKVDWTKQDVVLEDELGCSRQAVHQKRHDPRYGNGRQAAALRVHRGDTARNLLAEMATEGKTLPQLAKAAGCTEGRAAKIMRALGKDFKRRPKGGQLYRWERFPTNWRSLTDKEIAKIVGAGYGDVVAQWRARHGYEREVRVS